MTNREFYKEQILDVACSGGAFAVDKRDGKIGECLMDIHCNNCLFGPSYNTCMKAIKEWSEQEHIE